MGEKNALSDDQQNRLTVVTALLQASGGQPDVLALAEWVLDGSEKEAESEGGVEAQEGEGEEKPEDDAAADAPAN